MGVEKFAGHLAKTFATAVAYKLGNTFAESLINHSKNRQSDSGDDQASHNAEFDHSADSSKDSFDNRGSVDRGSSG